jgi:hypothetical protein
METRQLTLDDYLGSPSNYSQPTQQSAPLEQALGSNPSYIPTAPAMPLTFGQKAENVGSDILSGVNKYVAQPINTGVGSAIEGFTQGVADVANTPVLGQLIEPMTGLFPNMKAVKAPFVNESSITGKIIKTLAPFAVPEMGAKSAVGSLGIEGFRGANILRNILTQAATGYVATSGSQAHRATNALIGGTLGGATSTILKIPGVLNTLRKLPQEFIDTKAQNTVATLAQGNTPQPSNAMNDFLKFSYNKFLGNPTDSKIGMPDFKQINDINGTKIIESAKNQKNIWGNEFNKTEQSAVNKGYTADAMPKVDTNTGTVTTTGKIINTSQKTGEMFNNLLNPESKSLIKSISPTTQKLIQNYKRIPSYTNAHLLQSALGNESADFKNIAIKDAGDRETASALYNTQQAVRKDIMDTFKKNGDTDLQKQLIYARNGWKNNVVPYGKAKGIKGMVRTGNIPNDVLKTLSSGDTNNYMNVIRSHVASDSSFRNSLLAQQLMTRTQGITKPNVGVNEVISQYEKTPNVLHALHMPDTGNALNALRDQAASVKKYGNWVKGTGALIGGYEGLRHLGL